MKPEPDAGAAIKILLHGVFYGCPGADAMVVERDRIRWIGRGGELPAEFPGDASGERIDLEGRFVLPGFIDAHIHLLEMGLVESGWRIGLMGRSRSEVLELLAQAADERAGEWVVGYGWDESCWQDRRFLTRRELDLVSPRSPMLAIRMDGHVLAANRLAMEQVPESAPEELIDREAGLLREQAVAEMTTSVRPDCSATAAALDAAARSCHRLGITTVHTMTRLDVFPSLLRGRERRRLRIIQCPDVGSFAKLCAVGLESGYGDQWLRFGGVKIFADGSIGAGNAAVSEPYVGGGIGALNHTDEQMADYVKAADRAGWQTVIHAIGDRAIDQVLRTHEALATNRSLRHRIEHFELPQGHQLSRARRAGLNASMQPNFIANWSGSGGLYVERLGVERDRKSNPLRAIHDEGIAIALGSDGMPASPLYGLHGAIHGPYPGQRLSLDEALAGYTATGAWFGFEEHEKGTLRPGQVADLVVLDEDPRRDPAQTRNRSIDMTFVGGVLVHEAGGSASPA